MTGPVKRQTMETLEFTAFRQLLNTDVITVSDVYMQGVLAITSDRNNEHNYVTLHCWSRDVL